MKSKERISAIILTTIYIILHFLPMISIGGKPYNIYFLLTGEISGITSGYMRFLGGSLLLLLVMGIIYLFLLISGHSGTKLEIAIAITAMPILIADVQVIYGYSPLVDTYFLIPYYLRFALIYIEAGVRRFIVARDDLIEEKAKRERLRKLKVADRRANEQNEWIKRKNPNMLYHILWKNFRKKFKKYLLLVISMALANTLLFLTIGIWKNIQNIHSTAGVHVVDGITDEMMNIIYISIAVSVLLIAFVFHNYILSRIRENNFMQLLGIQQKTLKLSVLIEYFSTIIISIIVGLTLGSAVLRYYIKYASSHYNINMELNGMDTLQVYVISTCITLVVFFISAAVSYETFAETGMSSDVNNDVRRDRLPELLALPGTIAGLVLIAVSVAAYGFRYFHETVFCFIIMSLGVFLLVYFGGSMLLNAVKRNKPFYYKHLITINRYYYRFKSNVSTICVSFILNMLVLLIFGLGIFANLPSQDISSLYPYDAVYKAYESDTEALSKLNTNYITGDMIPILVPGGDADYEGGLAINVEGQHFGIPESTYEKLTKEKLNLGKKDIALIYQEDISDSAHPLDWCNAGVTPRMAVSLPKYYKFEQRQAIFSDDYNVKYSMREVIFGYFVNGIQEDIIVFSDDEFVKLSKENEAADKVYLFNFKSEAEENETMPILQKLAESHADDYSYHPKVKNLYTASEIKNNVETEKAFRLGLYSFMALLMIVYSAFIFYVKSVTDLYALVRKNQFLAVMGERRRDRLKALKTEIRLTALIPLIMSIILSLLSLQSIFRARMFTFKEAGVFMSGYWKYAAAYTIFMIIVMFIIEKLLIRRIEKNG